MAEVDVYAVFIDVMGFADSVLALEPEHHSHLERNLRLSVANSGASEKANALADRYREFHQLLQAALDFNESDIQFVIVFSDSAYIIADEFETAANVAFGIVRGCLFSDIPVRAGLGRGTFARLAFSTLSHPAGALFVDAPFLGTAVINAYYAEHNKNAAGFRIFVHPSAVQDAPPYWCTNLAPAERSEVAAQEIDFLSPWPAYVPFDPLPQMLDHLNRMRQLVALPEGARRDRVLRHYDATLLAAERFHKLEKDYPSSYRK